MSKTRKVFAQIKFAIDHHALTSWMDPLARKLGVVKFLHLVWDVLDKDTSDALAKEFQAFYESHEGEFDKLMEMLEDDRSRYTMKRVIEFRTSYNRSVLKDVEVHPQYFQKDIFGPVKDEVFVDGGAYVGDTVKSCIKNFTGGGYKRIYAWEPDPVNFKCLKRNTAKLNDIVHVPCGMWSGEGELHFLSDGTMRSSIAGTSEPSSVTLKVNSIDNVCAADKVTFIKMDVEGCEMEALKGAENVIRRDKPRLAICLYHKPEDLYEIPFWVKETVPEYKLYVRHHSDRVHETVLYATL